jgi:uncharacterized protein (DUF2235 family)
MARKLILCLDGTWNHPDDDSRPDDVQVETNVRRIFEAALDGSKVYNQVKWYDDGIGGPGSCWFDRIGAGAFGLGLDVKILDAYRYLADVYEKDDEIFLFGYSRGAYSARSLLGLIRKCGLVYREYRHFAGQAYAIYRGRNAHPDCREAVEFRLRYSREIPIHTIGLFDCVGSLGIPLDAFARLNRTFYEYHDVTLSSIVANAYHAVAIDEHRSVFNVTMWDPPAPVDQNLEQRWFAGSHADVGGGVPDRRLSDLSLRWMMERALEHGIIFEPRQVPLRIERNHLAHVSDAYADFLEGGFSIFSEPHLRPVGQTLYGNEVLDESVLRKMEEDPHYVPMNPGVFVG